MFDLLKVKDSLTPYNAYAFLFKSKHNVRILESSHPILNFFWGGTIKNMVLVGETSNAFPPKPKPKNSNHTPLQLCWFVGGLRFSGRRTCVIGPIGSSHYVGPRSSGTRKGIGAARRDIALHQQRPPTPTP